MTGIRSVPTVATPPTTSSLRFRWGLAVYGLALGLVSGLRVWLMIPRAFDLGFLANGLAAVWRDGPLAPVPWAGVALLEDHFSPLLLTLSPLAALPMAPVILVLVQAISVCTALVILWRTAESVSMESRHRSLIVAAVALHPALLYAALFDVHANVLALPFLALMFRGVITGDRTSVLVGGLSSALLREELAFLLIPLALLNWHRMREVGGRWLVGGAVLSLAAWLALRTGKEMGAFSLFGYVDFGRPDESAVTALSYVFEEGRVVAVLVVLATPWIFLRPMNLRLVLPVVITLAPLVASASPVTRVITFHYYAMVPLVLAFAVLDRWETRPPPRPPVTALAWSLVALWLAMGPLGASLLGREYTQNSLVAIIGEGRDDGASARHYREALACVPEEMSLAVDSEVTPFVSDRSEVYLLPHPFRDLPFDTGLGTVVLNPADRAATPAVVVSGQPPHEVRQTFRQDPSRRYLWWRDAGQQCID